MGRPMSRNLLKAGHELITGNIDADIAEVVLARAADLDIGKHLG